MNNLGYLVHYCYLVHFCQAQSKKLSIEKRREKKVYELERSRNAAELKKLDMLIKQSETKTIYSVNALQVLDSKMGKPKKTAIILTILLACILIPGNALRLFLFIQFRSHSN